MTQHASLSPERWARFDLPKQILQIALELHRGSSALKSGDAPRLQPCLERALRLADLTIAVNTGRSLRRELLRLRSAVAEIYVDPAPRAADVDLALRVLLQMHPECTEHVELLGA